MNPVQLTKYLLRFVLQDRRKKYGTHVEGEEIFSANFQDLAVINLFQRKRSGTFIEVGSQDPVKRSNTYALEVNYGWRGLSFEIDPECVNFFNRFRQNPCLAGDATTQDYAKLFKSNSLPETIDFLQIDIDPPSASLEVLKRMPFEQYQFSFIAFEHDRYQFGPEIAKEQREFLTARNYMPLALDASVDGRPIEDWWINPREFARLKSPTELPFEGRECQDVAIWLRDCYC